MATDAANNNNHIVKGSKLYVPDGEHDRAELKDGKYTVSKFVINGGIATISIICKCDYRTLILFEEVYQSYVLTELLAQQDELRLRFGPRKARQTPPKKKLVL